jgi:S1-C subfamily serine protease
MENRHPTPNPRICPSCERRVPPSVEQCRCGHVFPSAANPDGESEKGSEARHPWLGPVAALIIAVAAGVYMFRPSPPAPVAPASAIARLPSRSVAPATSTAGRTSTPPVPARPVPTAEPPLPSAVPLAPVSFEDIIGNATAAVVSIETPGGRGSGFFVTPELVLTNAHVVASNSSVVLRMSDGTTTTGRVQRAAPEVDIAIVRVNHARAAQPTMMMGTVKGARAGQEVIAIGSALGMLQNTVTRGIVSAVRNANGVILIQTDAAINRGNSGGPLIDRHGRVLGIATLKIGANSESLGFAVAIDHAGPLLEGRPAERVAAAGGTAQSTPLSGAFNTPRSQTDVMRDAGAVQFERVMQAAARRADSLDDYWSRFRVACGVSAVPNAGDREWFGVWDREPSFNTADVRCTRWLSDVNQVAGGIRQAMVSADEAARTASVYPGVRRDLRRKYKLDWDGWER